MDWATFFEKLASFKILLPFVPLLVAIDALGILPIFISLTSEMDLAERKRIIRQSVLTAFLVSLAFLGAGKSVFALLGISIADFKIAGGILLFTLSIVDLIFPERTRTFAKETLGIVPIGIPLIAGPGVLTILLMVIDIYGYLSTILCLTLNLLIVWLVFSQSQWIMKILKEGGTRGIAKVSSLLLAAFAVMMIRKGIMDWINLVSKQ